MSDDLLSHVMELKESVASLRTDMAHVKNAVMGDGQPGLEQKVESLQASRNWMWGVWSGVTFLGGLAEWLFHRKHG